jgi:hypothetical protein
MMATFDNRREVLASEDPGEIDRSPDYSGGEVIKRSLLT